MVRTKMMLPEISSAGYDALCAVLELEFIQSGEIWRFYDVPEQIWYEWRKTGEPAAYFRTHIAGRYEAGKIFPDKFLPAAE